MSDELDIIAVKTENNKYYIAERQLIEERYPRSNGLRNFLFDGKNPEATHDYDWVCIDSYPKIISKMQSQPNINLRYELQDKSLISDKLPEFVKREDVAYYDESEYEWVWKDEMVQYESLYKLISDKQPDKEVFFDFKFEVIFETKEVKNPIKMSYKVSIGQKEKIITYKDINHQLIDKVIFPSILLNQRPCSLSHEDSYQIVRQYIKENIDKNLASFGEDWSDYLEINRRVVRAIPLQYQEDINNNAMWRMKRRKPKYVDRVSNHKEYSCLKLTCDKKRNKDYTLVPSFVGKNQEDLKKNIDAYCKNLMEFINKEFKECKHCNGAGLLITNEKFDFEKLQEK